jgi:2-keto-4-pentenoate hydratase/2-oxohepta-3-ene-1,7-dioic acid hydratase in catechol pathway
VRIARFSQADQVRFGVIDGTQIAVVDTHPFGDITLTGERVEIDQVRLLAPILPSKIIAVGKNYADHIAEMGGGDAPSEPMVFLKPSTSVIGPDAPIVLPWQSEHVDHEAELAVVMGRMCRDVAIEDALSMVLGYTCANDVSARDLQRRDGQWGRAKGFDTFCPLGPWIETDLDPSDLAIGCTVNDETRQAARTSLLLRGVPELISWISSVMTLLPGDVIITGTPAGVGPLADGDEVSVTIEGIGTLTNPVVDGPGRGVSA